MIGIEKAVALFIVGMAVGIGLHRLIMALVLENSPDTTCAYCEWRDRKYRERGRLWMTVSNIKKRPEDREDRR